MRGPRRFPPPGATLPPAEPDGRHVAATGGAARTEPAGPGMMPTMYALNLAEAFITFFAVVGPPKVLLAFAHLAEDRSAREIRRLGVAASGGAAAVGVLGAYLAPALLGLFHIGRQALELAGGLIFFVYALGLVLGGGPGVGDGRPEDAAPGGTRTVGAGVRALLLPFVASPVAVTVVLTESVLKGGWGWRTTVAGGYLAVVLIDLLSVLLLAALLRRSRRTVVELLARLLGLLLAAVGVELFLDGLGALGVPVYGPVR